MKTYPALDVRCDSLDTLLALIDDFSPAAIDERDDSVRVFFAKSADRDAARFAVASRFPVAPVEVSDEDWARRSQDNLQPITIGRLTIVPNPNSLIPDPNSLIPDDSLIPNHPRIPNPNPLTPDPTTIVIVPSMGFGTGHHATTRLCLEALQSIDLVDAFVLDVGTGSGILAIAAARLGAARAIGIDNDPDAIQAANENLAHNHFAPSTRLAFEESDLVPFLVAHRGWPDVVAANLTGGLLIRTAAAVQEAVQSGGTIIVSGVLAEERDEVARAFESTPIVEERTADEWVCLMMKKR